MDFIQNNNIIEISTDPTEKFKEEINRTINECQELIDFKIGRNLKNMNPRAPQFNAQPKIHKENIPVRPLINFRTSPSFKLAKYLENIIKKNIKIKKNYSLFNNKDLVDKISNIQMLSSCKFASFDITNMYTNIPIDKTIQIIEKNLKINKSLNNSVILDIVKLLNVILKQNYYTFNGKNFSFKTNA